jgi:molecular chaperone GrpE
VTDRRHPEESHRVPIVDKRVAARNGGDEPEQAPPPAPQDAALAEAQQLAEERLDQLKRLKADLENYRKRVIREQTDLVERASLRVVEQLLPVFDDFERAVASTRAHTDDEALVRGLEIVLQRLRSVLEAEGLERVEAKGPFDPHEHEAVSSVPADVSEPTILEVVRPGYRLKGRTIRPALVNVAIPEGDDG